VMVERDIAMAELTGGRFHVAHMSARQSLRAVRAGKDAGVNVTCEVTPHHFTLTDDVLAERGGYDTNFKMNPPLRSARDREAILEGLADGTIEVLCSDHAPHCDYEKEVEFDYAPFGITGLETELPLSLMQLHHAGGMSLIDLIGKFTTAPARLLRLAKGTLSVGADADVTVFDPDCEWVYGRADSASKSKNSPFDGWTMKGRATMTIVGGKVVWRGAEQLASA